MIECSGEIKAGWEFVCNRYNINQLLDAGVIGSFLFAISAVPEAIRTFKTGQCDLTWGMLWLCAFAEVFCTYKALAVGQYWLLVNYIPNGLILFYLMTAKIKGVMR